MDIGKNIKCARKNSGMTQEQLAKKCNLATITIRQYESGKREPKMEQLSALASALDVHVLELLGYPAREQRSLSGTFRFSVDHMANQIAKKYCLAEDTARNIVEDCYQAIKLDGQEFQKTATMADFFDELDTSVQKEALERLQQLIQESPSEESADEP